LSRPHNVTISEIARMTGVSTQTVSRVINNRPGVSPEKRDAVLAAIARVGFLPSAVARSLVLRRSRLIGVIAARLSSFGVSQTLNGIAKESELSGHALLLKEVTSVEVQDIVPAIEFLVANRVQGVIIAAPQLGANLGLVMDQLPANRAPVVFLKAQASLRFTTVGIDNEDGGRRATEHLVAIGRTRIGHLSGPLLWREARDRRDGWLAALHHAGLTPGATASGDWSSASGVVAFERMLCDEPDMDGLFVGNDQMALGALQAANKRGLRIPDDIAVVGFDGLPEIAQFHPSLATIRQPLGELGGQAVRELLADIDAEPGQAVVHSITLPLEFVPGASAPLAAHGLTAIGASELLRGAFGA
jgi:LacI family transcriptional regulator